MRIQQRRLLAVVVGVALAASALPFPGSAPVRGALPGNAEQAMAVPIPALYGEGY